MCFYSMQVLASGAVNGMFVKQEHNIILLILMLFSFKFSEIVRLIYFMPLLCVYTTYGTGNKFAEKRANVLISINILHCFVFSITLI